MALQTEVFSTKSSDFLKQIIFLKSFNSVFFCCFFFYIMQTVENKQFFCIFACMYSSIQMKCQGGNKYALSITVKFDQSTRRFGRISFARLFKFTKHIALLFYLLSPYLLSCMRGSRNVRTNMHIIKTIMKFWAH